MKKTKSRGWILFLYFPLTIIYLEFVVAMHSFGRVLNWGALYTILFSIVFGGVCAILSSIWSRKTNRTVSIILMVLLTLIFGTQAVYFTIFKTFTGFHALTLAGEAIGGFWKEALSGIWSAKFTLFLIFLPLLLNLIFGKRFMPEKRLKFRWCVLIMFLLAFIQINTILLIGTNTTGIMSYRYVYYDTYSSLLSVPRFGVLTTARLELQGMLDKDGNLDSIIDSTIPTPDESESPPPTPSESSPTPVFYGDNALNIDFTKLIESEDDPNIRDMHEYFSAQVPTKQNEYTGMFEGKNLIWIVAEGFSTGALDETHTPTLYKLAHEGFVFNNFYNPIWYGSTSDGEFVTLTGLLPKAGKLSFKLSADNSMPFGFGNLMGDIGYTTKAYHNHTYTYYGRDKSHPNLGYDYMGVGNGLVVTKQWPASDVEMIDQTTEHYVNEDNFHVYYLTVSGHLLYTFTGNMMAYKHREDVADLPYTDNVRAYIASQMETDLAIELLIDRLKEAGKLKDTVIVLSGDHYPYGLETPELLELGMPDDSFELYRSSLIIWNSEMETEEVDKYCSSLDIMPTLANLFNLDYDSRLVSGSDIFSDEPALVIFNDRSWITDFGRYSSAEDTFEAAPGAEIPEGYAVKILKKVNSKFAYAAKIIEFDYYSKIFPG